MEWLRAMWYGLLLICPRCHEGKLYASWTVRNDQCPVCGANFEPGEGDFLGSMFMAYTGTVVVVGTAILLLGLLTDISLTDLLTYGIVASAVFLVLTYRNMRGVWIGIVYMMTGFRRDP